VSSNTLAVEVRGDTNAEVHEDQKWTVDGNGTLRDGAEVHSSFTLKSNSTERDVEYRNFDHASRQFHGPSSPRALVRRMAISVIYTAKHSKAACSID
jgi:hypothetical protein